MPVPLQGTCQPGIACKPLISRIRCVDSLIACTRSVQTVAARTFPGTGNHRPPRRTDGTRRPRATRDRLGHIASAAHASMDDNDTSTPPRHPRLARAVALAGHPLLLAGALGLWRALGASDDATLAVLAAVLAASMTLERLVPAMPGWRLGLGAHLRLGGIYLVGLLLSGLMIAGYEALLPSALEDVRARIGAVLWPAGWPTLVQALLLFFASDLIYYWAHRAIHRWAPLWRMTGHGFHHGFQNLHAINTGTNHPFELVLLTLPLILLAALTGAPDAATSAAAILLMANATLAHANVRMDTPVFNWFITGSDQHRRHHSAVFEESNTNYACNAILWDRLFGTFSRGAVVQTGIGPTQPGLWRMFLLPFREPGDADTVSKRAREAG